MKISELKPGQSGVEVEGDVIDVSETRTFNKFGRDLSVATATLADSSGTVKLTLWNQDIETVKAGDKIKISNGYVGEFQGEKQLTSGKFGKLEVIGKADIDLSSIKKEENQEQLSSEEKVIDEGMNEAEKIEDEDEEELL